MSATVSVYFHHHNFLHPHFWPLQALSHHPSDQVLFRTISSKQEIFPLVIVSAVSVCLRAQTSSGSSWRTVYQRYWLISCRTAGGQRVHGGWGLTKYKEEWNIIAAVFLDQYHQLHQPWLHINKFPDLRSILNLSIQIFSWGAPAVSNVKNTEPCCSYCSKYILNE